MEQRRRGEIDNRAVRDKTPFRYANLRDVVDAVRSRLDVAFIDGVSLERIRNIALHFPANASDFFGFERSVGRTDARADFAVGISEPGAAWLCYQSRWPAVADVFARCIEHVAIGKIRPWLEFDTSLATQNEAQPSVYIGVDPRRTAALALCGSVAQNSDVSFFTVARCLESLPAGASCLYIGTMLGRSASELRLSFAALDSDELREYLCHSGWPGDVDAVGAFLSRFSSVSTRYGIQIDIGSGVRPNLGIEMLVEPNSLTERANEDIVRLLRLLVEQRMCSPNECAELAHWPHVIASSSSLIDRYLAAVEPPDASSFDRSLISALHHVKFSFASDRPIRTKAYFGVFLDSR